MVFESLSWLNLDTCVSWLCLEFPCLVMSYDCVVNISLSRIAKCLFCAEALAFPAESRPLGPLSGCLLSAKRLFFMATMCLDNCMQCLSLKHFNSVSV